MAVASLVVRISAQIAEFEKGLASAERSFQKTGKSLESIGSRMTKGITLPIIAIAGVAAKAAIDFESSFAGVRKTVDATEAEFKGLEGAFRNLANTMPLSVNEINKVAEAAGQLGVKKEQIVGFTETMVKLGATTNLTAEEAATAMARFANALGQPEIDINKLGASLVALGNAGASTEKDILDMAGRMAGAGAQIGLSAGSVFGMANALSSVGINAEKGGTAISRLFSDINKAVSEGGTKMKEFAKVANLSGAEFQKLFKEDAAAAISKFIEGLNAQKAAGGDLIKTLAGLGITQALYKDTVLLAANSGKQFAESIKLGNRAFAEGKALNNEYQERLKTTASQLIILKNNVNDVAITLGQAFLPQINRVVGGLKPLVGLLSDLAIGFGKLPEPIRDTTLAFLALLAAAGPLVFLVGKVSQAWAALIKIIQFVPIALGGLATAFLALVGSMTGVSTGVTGFTGVLFLARGAVTALLAPVGLLTLAIGGLAIAVPKALDGIKNLNKAISEGRFWQFVTTKDAPAIWEKAFWGMGTAADSAATSLGVVAGKGKDIVLPLDDAARATQALTKQLSGAGLSEEVAKLANAFAAMTPQQQRSADVMKRVGEEALRLKDAGAQLTPELEKLAKAAARTETAGFKKAADDIKRLAEEIDNLAKRLAGADAVANVKLWAAAIAKAGGIQKLTTRDLEEFGSVIDEVEDRFGTFERAGVGAFQNVATAAKALLQKGEPIEIPVIPVLSTQTLAGISAAALPPKMVLEIIPQMSDATLATIGVQISKARIDWAERARGFIDDLKQIGLDAARGIGDALAVGIRTGNWSGFENSLRETLANAMGAAFAAAVNLVVPGLGTALQGFFTAASDAFLGFVGLGTRGRDLVKAFAEAAGGFDALRDRLRELGAEGERLWVNLTQQVGRDNAAQAQAAIDAINAAFAAAEAGMKKFADGAMKRIKAFAATVKGAAGGISDDLRKMVEMEMPELEMGVDERAARDAMAGFIDTVAGSQAELQAEFSRLGLYAGTAFAETLRDKGLAEAIRVAGPMFDELIALSAEFGFTLEGSAAAFATFFETAKANQDVVDALEGITLMIQGAGEAAFLTQELFSAFGTDAVAQFDKLIARGVPVQTALALSRDAIQALWEAQQKFGLETDAATQALIDQGVEAGIVGANQMDVNEKILVVLLAIADTFKAKIPDGIRATGAAASTVAAGVARDFASAGQKAKDALADIEAPPVVVDVEFNVGDFPHIDPSQFEHFNAPQFATGGIVRRPTLAMIGESGPELVIPLQRLREMAFLDGLRDRYGIPGLQHGGIVRSPTLALVGESGPEAVIPLSQLGSTGQDTTIILEVDGRAFAEVVVPHIPGAVTRLGLGV